MWAVNLTVGYLYPGRSEPYVNAIFGTIIGAVFVIGRKHNQTHPDRPERKRTDKPPSDEGGDL